MKLNQVDNDYSVTTKNLADSLSKSAAAAATYGVSLDELLAYTTAIGTVTRETGSILGNSLKSIFASLYSDKGASALAEVGIAVTDLNGENRKASDIISDLGNKWKSLSKTQQENTAISVAGKFQLTRFLALFNDWDIAMKATTTSMNSQGSAARENEKFMQSLQAKLNLLATSWEQLAITVGDKGLKEVFGGLVLTLTSLAKGFGELTNATDGWNIKLPLLAAGLYGAVKAFQVFKLAAEGAKLSLGWIGVGLIAVESLSTLFVNASKSAEINTQAFIDNANHIKGNADQIQGLIDKYDKLLPTSNETATKQAELQTVLKQINDIAPQLIDRTDKYGDSLSLNKDKATAYIAALREMNQEQLKQAQLANGIQLNNVSSQLETTQQQLNK